MKHSGGEGPKTHPSLRMQNSLPVPSRDGGSKSKSEAGATEENGRTSAPDPVKRIVSYRGSTQGGKNNRLGISDIELEKEGRSLSTTQ